MRELIESKLVSGWDDTRLPTLKGLRRLGYPPEAILEFVEKTAFLKTIA
jgi:glutaminyl-tRNA synthetase